jgi:hypothetical protein
MLVAEAIEACTKVSGHLTGSTPRWPGLLARRLALSLPHDELPAIRVRGGESGTEQTGLRSQYRFEDGGASTSFRSIRLRLPD